jgi:hypothetical protein
METSMIKTVLSAALLLTGTAAIAADGREPESGKKSGMVCRVQGETGSRLGSRKVCMSRQQWEEQKRDTRQAIDRAQTQQVNKNGG